MSCGSRLFVAFALAVLPAAGAHGHDPGLSDLRIVADADHVEASWWIDSGDLAGSEPQAVGALLLEVDGDSVDLEQAHATTTWDRHRRLTLRWRRGPRATLRIAAPLLEQLPLGHRVLVQILEPSGRMAPEAMLSARNPTLEWSP